MQVIEHVIHLPPFSHIVVLMWIHPVAKVLVWSWHGLTLFAGELFFFVSSRIEMNWRYSEFFHLPHPREGKRNRGESHVESKHRVHETQKHFVKCLKGVFGMLTGCRPCTNVSMITTSYWHAASAARIIISKDGWIESVEICHLTSETGHSYKTDQHSSHILTHWNQLTAADVS